MATPKKTILGTSKNDSFLTYIQSITEIFIIDENHSFQIEADRPVASDFIFA